MLTVATVLKSGGIYDATWVARLRAGVARRLPVPHRFLCLSDVPVPCDRVALEHGWPGWWSKIEALRIPGPVLYMDLDTLPVGDLTEIAAAATLRELVALRDWNRPAGIGSGVLAWKGDQSALYRGFLAMPQLHMDISGAMGDQDFILRSAGSDRIARWQDVVPGQIASYKIDRCFERCPPGTRLMALHGWPKFGDMPPGSWARREWEAAA